MLTIVLLFFAPEYGESVGLMPLLVVIEWNQKPRGVDVSHLLINYFTSVVFCRFPSGVQTRIAVCLKTLSLMALICLRIGREMVQQHMADTLCRFFAVFTLLHSLQPQVDTHFSSS